MRLLTLVNYSRHPFSRLIIPVTLASALLIGVSPGCSSKEDVIPTNGGNPADTVFYGDVKPIFDGECAIAGCHVGASPAADLRMDTYANIMAGAGGNPVVVAGNSMQSHLYMHITGASQPMMPVDGTLTPAQINSIKNWIDDGALE